MFIIGGLGYVIPAVFFWIFGSAEIQNWNHINKSHPDVNTQESQSTEPEHTKL